MYTLSSTVIWMFAGLAGDRSSEIVIRCQVDLDVALHPESLNAAYCRCHGLLLVIFQYRRVLECYILHVPSFNWQVIHLALQLAP